MVFDKIVPEWNAAGSEPPDTLKESGFTAGYKPPAAYFNWFFNGMGEVAKELQSAGLFAYLGDNPINEAGDTVDAWVALGSGYARYTDVGTLTDKPSRYGVLLSVCVNGKDMFQLWYVAPTGPLFHRGGNTSGWNGTWKKVYDTANKPTINEIMTAQLSVALGGTGATTKKDAFKNLAFLGQNPIASVEEDTIENWAALGSGFAWISELDRLNNQPSNYGLLINYVPNNYEVTQIWKTHSSGAMFIRSGNSNGWGQQWTKIYDSLNKPTPAEIGATPIVNAESANYDMDVIISSGDHAGMYLTNQNTLGTPYKKGVSTYTEALILSYGSSASYAMQIAFVSGNQPLVRFLHNGALSDWYNILTSAQAVTIEQGGTNANNRADAMQNIAFIGENPITTTAEDTSANWVALGTGYAWYNGAGQLLNQPNQYGMLLNMVSGVEVTQIWKSHATGAMWIRSGNKAGWGQVWAKVFDTLNPPSADNVTGILPVSKGGTGANSVAGALANLGAFRNLGKQIIASTADDTVANWALVDSGYSYYETAGLLNSQPSQYGILISFRQSTEIFQIWRTQSGGPTYWRSGNAKGWASSWAKVYDGSNKPTIAEIGAAPAGYGLGETANTYYPTSESQLEAMLDEVLSGLENGSVGFYAFRDNTGSVWGGGECIALVRKTESDYATVDFCSYGYRGMRLLKTKYGGIWTSLEWVNPPMHPGTEYRTTERYMGLPVYVKLVNFGYLPNTSVGNVPITGDGVAYPVKAFLLIGGSAGAQGTAIGNDYPYISEFYTGTDTIVIATNANVSDMYARVQIYYTKG